jgi:hypothetical protein
MNDKTKLQEPVYRTEAQSREMLEALEQKADLFRYKFDGYSAWRILRFEAMSILQNLPFTSKVGQQPRTRRLFREIRQSFLDLPRILFPKHAKYVVKTASSALRETEGGLLKDVYFDDLIRELGSSYKIERLNIPVRNYRRKDMLFPLDITTGIIDLFTSFMSQLVTPRSVADAAVSLSEAIRLEPALQRLSLSKIQNALSWFYWSKWFYSMLLRKIKPAYVLTTSSGEFAIWAAAQELGVVSVEFQHGIFSHNHPHALPGFALRYRDSLIVPDKLLMYGQYWIDKLKKNQFYQHELIPVGNHRIDRYRQIRNERMSSLDKSNSCIILFTAQGLDRERLADFISRFLSIMRDRLDCRVFVKLHPRETDKKAYERYLSSFPNAEISLAAEEPTTFDLMTRSHYHCSIASAAHYDALGIGVPTIILPLAGHELMSDLVSSGHATLVHSPQELADVVLGSHDVKISPDIISYYYCPNALQNIKKHIG